MPWKVVTPPTYTSSASLSTVKDFLKVSENADDTLIAALIATATRMIERKTQTHLLTQTWDLFLDRFRKHVDRVDPWWNGSREGHQASVFPAANIYIKLTKAPVASITSISTFGTDNVETTFDAASYLLDDASTPSRIALNDGYSWPSDGLREVNAFKIRCVLGYGADPTFLPDDLETALYMLVHHLYDNRAGGEMKMPELIKEMLEPFIMLDL